MLTALKGLLSFLPESSARCRAACQWVAKFDFDVAHDLAVEAQTDQAKIAHKAYTAEQADREALRSLEAALADGNLDASDLPAIQTALNNVRRSAEHDREISEALTA